MDHSSTFEKVLRGTLITLVLIFFLFPIFWIFLMSLQTNETILRIPPSIFFEPNFDNYRALITGKLQTTAGNLDIAFMHNLWNSILLSTCSVALSLVLGVPAAYAFARFKFRLGEDIAFTLLSFRFAPPLLVLLPLSLYFKTLGLTNTYIGLIWVYQLICLPLILWIVRGYFEDISRTSSMPTASPGTAGGGHLPKSPFRWHGPVLQQQAFWPLSSPGTISFLP
jgi:multiple sugar transport system permease protein